MEVTNELIDNVMERLNNGPGGQPLIFTSAVLSIISILREIESDRTIGVNYTPDEYGIAAKELGVPQKVYPDDAGIDLPIVLSQDDRKLGKIVWPGEREMLHTGLITEFPEGWHGKITHRSSTEKKYRLRVVEGIIDNYRGELLVQVHNENSCQVVVHHGQKLGQLILLPTSPFKCEIKQLKPSARQSNGFGSTNK